MKIFMDEMAWLAMADQNHPLHNSVKEHFKLELDSGNRFYTTNVIIGNTISYLKQNKGAQEANRFYDILEEAWLGTHLHVMWFGRRTHKDAIKLFKKFPDSQLSFFDCVNVVLMNRRNIRFIMTSNTAYSKMGFKIIPEIKG